MLRQDHVMTEGLSPGAEFTQELERSGAMLHGADRSQAKERAEYCGHLVHELG